jgi:hypothetical protein
VLSFAEANKRCMLDMPLAFALLHVLRHGSADAIAYAVSAVLPFPPWI